jgi:hypothetical protein
MLHERLHQICASINVQIRPFLLLNFGRWSTQALLWLKWGNLSGELEGEEAPENSQSPNRAPIYHKMDLKPPKFLAHFVYFPTHHKSTSVPLHERGRLADKDCPLPSLHADHFGSDRGPLKPSFGLSGDRPATRESAPLAQEICRNLGAQNRPNSNCMSHLPSFVRTYIYARMFHVEHF